MPLPAAVIAALAAAGAAGVGSGVNGAVKMKNASETMKITKERHEKNLEMFEEQSEITGRDMDSLGEYELKVLKSFERFSDVIEEIHNRPRFSRIDVNGASIPAYDHEKIKEVSVGAGVLLGGLGGAAVGTAGGFAASGATTAAVMALGTASTGTAISSLSGAAAVNATLAAIGGGSLAAGGGGIAAGTAILGTATVGIGLLVGGVIFNITGSSLSNKADEAYRQMEKSEEHINKICDYLVDLSSISKKYKKTMSSVNKLYIRYIQNCEDIVFEDNKNNWNDFSCDEKQTIEITSMLVALLYSMCKLKLVLKSDDDEDIKKINISGIKKETQNVKNTLQDIGLETDASIRTGYLNEYTKQNSKKESYGSDIKYLIESRINKLVKDSDMSTAYVSSDFSNSKVASKLKKALSSYAKKMPADEVIAFIDISVFQNGGNGFLFGKYGLCFEYAFEKVYLKYSEIREVTLTDKQIELHGNYSSRKDQVSTPTISDIYCNLSEFKKLLDDIRYII